MSEIDHYKEAMQQARSELIDELSQRDFIIFAGSGVSEPTGILLWKELLKALDEKHALDGVKIDDLNEYQYPHTAQMLFEEFCEKGNAEEFKNVIKAKTQATKIPHTPTQEEMILASNGRIITTNFDDTFESAIEALRSQRRIQSEFTSQSLSNLCPETADDENHITYLHGRFDGGEDEIIFKTTDYAKHYPSLNGGEESPVEKVLRYLYLKPDLAIVFVGFSFEDKYVSRTLQRINNDIKMRSPRSIGKVKHYAILENQISENADTSNCEVRELLEKMESVQHKLEAINIGLLRYKCGRHRELYDIFMAINAKREAERISELALVKPEDEVSFK